LAKDTPNKEVFSLTILYDQGLHK